MKLLFLGSGEFGLPTLKALAAHHEVLAVVSQPDRPAGRHRRLTPTPIAAWAAEHRSNTPLFKPEDINTPDVISRLHALEADAWVVIAFGQKLSRTLVDDRFVINLHASLLPRWRGAAPINHAMLAGDAETGNSVITIAERMDAGFVLGQSKKPITVELTAGELHDLLASDGPALIEQVLAAHANHSLRPVTQDESLVTRARKLSRADSWIDVREPADVCRRRIHAFNPWPGVDALINNEPVKLLRARVNSAGVSSSAPTAGHISPEGEIITGEGDAAGVLQILELQPSGGKPMPWSDFARGRHLATETGFSSSPPQGSGGV